MIYTYKATIPYSKVFMREYEIPSNMKLFKFHEFLQNDLGFSPDQMVLFQGINSNGNKRKEYGLFDFGDGSMDTVSLELTAQRGETTLRYIYNLDKNLYINLDLISKNEPQPREYYPRTINEKGRNPEQFSSKYDDYELMSADTKEMNDDSSVDDYSMEESDFSDEER
jgi:hypothetical protein